MDQVISQAKMVMAGTSFVVNGVTYSHNGNQVFRLKDNQWVPYPLVQSTVPPVPGMQTNQANALPAQNGLELAERIREMEEKKKLTTSYATSMTTVAMGYLGADPTFRNAPSGVLCCNFNVGVDGYRQGQKYTYWLRCVIFGKAAEAQRGKLTKGSKVHLVATKPPEPKKFTGTDGQIRYYDQWTPDMVRWVGLKEAEDNAYNNGQQPPAMDQNDLQQAHNNFTQGAVDPSTQNMVAGNFSGTHDGSGW